MERNVSAHLDLRLDNDANLVFAISVAESAGTGSSSFTEALSFTSNGAPVEAEVVSDMHGTRLHQFDGKKGLLTVDYEATVIGNAEPVPVYPLDLITYLRPSRYCESDSLLPTAQSEFQGLSGKDLLAAVSSWVGDHLSYVPGSSHPTDGALRTLLARQGVCRDYAHLVIALLRALDVPARLVAVYAPGLDPMDFHAVAEAYIDDAWHVVDATTLAPRQSLVRISTGRDAADTAFLTSHGGNVALMGMRVMAVVDSLPFDDVREFTVIH
jgi:transglutaminase-like putative cysteine protease